MTGKYYNPNCEYGCQENCPTLIEEEQERIAAALETFNECVKHIGEGIATIKPDNDLGLIIDAALSLEELCTIYHAYMRYLDDIKNPAGAGS